MEWTYVDREIARRIGLIGAGDLREQGGCIYKRDEYGDWWELQVPAIPKHAPMPQTAD